MRGNPLIRVFFLANEPINSVGLSSRAEESGKKKASLQQSAPLLLSRTHTHTQLLPEPLLSLFGQLLKLGLFESTHTLLHSPSLSHTHTHTHTVGISPLIAAQYCSLVTEKILKDVLWSNFRACWSLSRSTFKVNPSWADSTACLRKLERIERKMMNTEVVLQFLHQLIKQFRNSYLLLSLDLLYPSSWPR